MSIVHGLLHALGLAGLMTWNILWSLILGFVLSAIVQAIVRKHAISKLLGSDKPKNLAIATGLGAASSSCSYASVALARSLFKRGASFTAAMVFEIASTNLVVELGIILAVLLGWRFTLAEFVGGPIIIILIAIIFRLFLRKKILQAAFTQANRGVTGSMEGHAAMDMAISRKGSFIERLRSTEGLTSISHIFVMEVAAVWKDLVAGLLIAGAIAAWVPSSVFRWLFITSHPLASKIWGPIIGPIIAMLSFVCSIGNVPLAAVLWSDGISFGGVVAFIFADLIIIPILFIYRKYYGTKMMLFILASFYVSMVVAGWLVEFIFGILKLVPDSHKIAMIAPRLSLNYTTILNIIFLAVTVWLVFRFIKTGALPMLKNMNGSASPK